MHASDFCFVGKTKLRLLMNIHCVLLARKLQVQEEANDTLIFRNCTWFRPRKFKKL